MSTAVDISNLALARIAHGPPISDFDPTIDDSQGAAQCALQYPTARDVMLSCWDWRFATAYATLAATVITPPRVWGYEYAKPADNVRIIGLVGVVRTVKRPAHGIGVNSTGQGVVWTDDSAAVLEYVSNVADPNAFSAQFVSALGWLLASYLAPIFAPTARTTVSTCLQMYQIELGKAQEDDTNSESPVERRITEVEAARA